MADNTSTRRCEWCGGHTHIEGDGRKAKFAWTECRSCGASGPAKATKVEAATAWNQVMRWAAEGKAKAKGDAA